MTSTSQYTFRIDKALIKEFKMLCLMRDTSIKAYVEELIMGELRKHKDKIK